MARTLLRWAERNGLFFALVVLTITFALSGPRFLTLSNGELILQQVAITGIVAVPAAMLLLSGYLDLSVGSVAVLASVVFGQVAAAGEPLALSVAAGLGTGALWGLLNAVLIVRLGLSPIVVTLGGLVGARGLAEYITEGTTQFGFGPDFAQLGNGTLLGLPIPVAIFALVVMAGIYVWYLTPGGRHMTAIGGDREAAQAAGVGVSRVPFLLYLASGLAAALGGLILASRLDSASLSIGQGQELQVLTAVLLGGVSFQGGRGALFGVVAGVLFIGVLNNGLVLLNVDPYVQGVAIGAALIFAGGLDTFYRRLDRVRLAGRDEEEPGGSSDEVVRDE